MSSNDRLGGMLAEVLDIFIEWYFAALHPIKTCRSLLSIADEHKRFVRAARLWFASFIVALVVYLPIYHSHGIEWDTLGFHLVSLLCLTVAIMVSGFAIHIGLRLYGISSTPSDVTAMYVAYFICYQPFAAILSYFTELRFLAILDSSKRQGMDFGQALAFSLTHARNYPEGLGFVIVSSLGSWLVLALTCVGLVLMAIEVAESYSVPKVRCFSALAFVWTILLPPFFVAQVLISAYFEYTFSR